MKRQFCLGVITFIATVLLASAATGKAVDPLIGTWELNIAKSKFLGPAPKSQTRKIVLVGDEIKTSVTAVRQDGTPAPLWEWSQSIHHDGKDRPMTGRPNYDMIGEKRVDAVSFEFTQKKDGKVVLTGMRIMSKDGKTMTITANGTNLEGQPITQVLVFDKQ